MKTYINHFASFAFVERNLAQGSLFPYNTACSRPYAFLKSMLTAIRDKFYCWLEHGLGSFRRCLPFFSACVLALAFIYPSQLTAQRLPRVSPKSAGMDARRLRYADEAFEQAIAEKEIPGAVRAVVRHGKMAYIKAYGNKRFYPYTEPRSKNTVFVLASCRKSVSTAISAMILIER